MPYTDVEKVRVLLAPDGDVEGTAASLDDAEIDSVIERVGSRIDMYLARNYTVPLVDPVPEVIEDIATTIAAYDLTLSYYKSTDITDQDPVVRRYYDIRGILTQLSTGLLVIDLPGADTTADDPVVINPPKYRPRSPGPGFEWMIVREYGPWEYRYGA